MYLDQQRARYFLRFLKRSSEDLQNKFGSVTIYNHFFIRPLDKWLTSQQCGSCNTKVTLLLIFLPSCIISPDIKLEADSVSTENSQYLNPMAPLFGILHMIPSLWSACGFWFSYPPKTPCTKMYIWSAILNMSILSVKAFHSSSNVPEIQKGSDFRGLVEVFHKTRDIFKIPRTTNSAPIEFQFPLQVIIVFTTL